MSDAASEFLLELRPSNWLSDIGRPCEGAEVLPAWETAFQTMKSSACQELILEMANQIRDRVQVSARSKYALWNQICRKFRPEVLELTDLKLSPDAAGRRLPKCVNDTISWYLLHATIELTYADLVTPHYFAPMCSWLHKGHLPISWNGEFPEGRPIVF